MVGRWRGSGLAGHSRRQAETRQSGATGTRRDGDGTEERIGIIGNLWGDEDAYCLVIRTGRCAFPHVTPRASSARRCSGGRSARGSSGRELRHGSWRPDAKARSAPSRNSNCRAMSFNTLKKKDGCKRDTEPRAGYPRGPSVSDFRRPLERCLPRCLLEWVADVGELRPSR